MLMKLLELLDFKAKIINTRRELGMKVRLMYVEDG